MRHGEPDSESAENPEMYRTLVSKLFSDALTLQDSARKPIPTRKQVRELVSVVSLLHEILHNPEMVHIEVVGEGDN